MFRRIMSSLVVVLSFSLMNGLNVFATETSQSVAANVVDSSVSIVSFGAKANDTIDDTYAIERTISHAKMLGEDVKIPEGIFIVSYTIDLPSNVNLIGEEKAVLKLKDQADSNTIMLRLRGGMNNKISGITFDGNIEHINVVKTPFESEAIINQSNGKIRTTNVVIENCKIQNTYSRGIRIRNAYNVVVNNNQFENVGFDNVTIMGESNNATVSNNNLQNGKSVGIKIYSGVGNVKVIHNVVNHFTAAAGDPKNNWSLGIELTKEITDINCSDNSVSNIGDIGISIAGVDGGVVNNNIITNVTGGVYNGLGLELFRAHNISASGNTIKNSKFKNAILSRATNCTYINNHSVLNEDARGYANTQHIEISSKDEEITSNCNIDGNTFSGGTRGILGGIANGINITNNIFDDNFVGVDYKLYGGGQNISIIGNEFRSCVAKIWEKDMVNLVFASNTGK